ncbi:MAG: hypothetical protein ACLRNQ_14500 [Flavonifractor plautii]
MDATGSRIVITLLYELRSRGSRYGLPPAPASWGRQW